jgi:flagellar basal-body rod protein FlgF
MIKGIYQTAQNMRLMMKDIEVVANNLANTNSTGYKRELPFSAFLSQTGDANLKQLTDFSEGTAVKTENPFDLMISGQGLFVLQTENGTGLTRDGKFTLTDDGYLVNEKGSKVLGEKGPINLSELLFDQSKTVKINTDGEIRIGDKLVDKLQIAKMGNQESIVRTQNQEFSPVNDEYELADEKNFSIAQGYIEESNVNPIDEMQAMIEINRNFETSQKMIIAFDNYLGKVNESGKV